MESKFLNQCKEAVTKYRTTNIIIFSIEITIVLILKLSGNQQIQENNKLNIYHEKQGFTSLRNIKILKREERS